MFLAILICELNELLWNKKTGALPDEQFAAMRGVLTVEEYRRKVGEALGLRFVRSVKPFSGFLGVS